MQTGCSLLRSTAGITTKDLGRQEDLERRDWTVIRFSDEDVENDAEAVGQAIAKELGIPYEFKKRRATGSGMRSVWAAKKQRPK